MGLLISNMGFLILSTRFRPVLGSSQDLGEAFDSNASNIQVINSDLVSIFFKELSLGFDFDFLVLSPIPLLVLVLEPKNNNCNGFNSSFISSYVQHMKTNNLEIQKLLFHEENNCYKCLKISNK
jgi:hypothetical protein